MAGIAGSGCAPDRGSNTGCRTVCIVAGCRTGTGVGAGDMFCCIVGGVALGNVDVAVAVAVTAGYAGCCTGVAGSAEVAAQGGRCKVLGMVTGNGYCRVAGSAGGDQSPAWGRNCRCAVGIVALRATGCGEDAGSMFGDAGW